MTNACPDTSLTNQPATFAPPTVSSVKMDPTASHAKTDIIAQTKLYNPKHAVFVPPAAFSAEIQIPVINALITSTTMRDSSIVWLVETSLIAYHAR